ncbi:hypothetical protein C3L33_13650, partial [Rhododendron williamsianum]
MIITFLSTGLCIFLLVVLFKLLHKVWWTPIRIQHIMASQGVKGPAYRFLHGNTKEIIQMREESISSAMDFSSHDVFQRIMPHIHAWKQLYGIKFFLFTFRIGGMIPAMIASVETMLEKWRQNEEKEIDVYKEFRLLTAEVISRTAFGSSYLEGENIFDMLTKLGMIAARNSFRIRLPGIEKFFKSRDDLESDKIEQAIREAIIGMIDKRKEKITRGEENNYGSDFLGSLIKANHDPDEKNRISIDDMVDECKNFYLAGQETTNGVLAWSIFLLAIHTDWQEKARKEVIELFGQEIPNPEGIARLKTVSIM